MMLKHYLTIGFRSFVKDKSFASVNIIGLAVAIACCLLLVFWIKFELSYEHCYPNAARIYKVLKVEKKSSGVKQSDHFTFPTAQLKEYSPQLSACSPITHESLPFSYQDDRAITVDFATATVDFLRMFSFEYVEGSPEIVAKDKGCIITEETAHKFFGKQSALGKTISFGTVSALKCKIEAVVKMPINTQVRFDVLDLSQTENGATNYIMLRKGMKLDAPTEKRISHTIGQLTGDTLNSYKLQPLLDVHLHSPEEIASESSDINGVYGNLKQIYLFTIIALLILFIAIINYINTSIARALGRLKEVGVRKVTGSTQGQLVVRFLSESLIISFLSVLIAYIFALGFYSRFSELMGNKVTFDLDAYSILFGILICILVSLLSGGYTAFYLSRLNTAKVLKGGSLTGSKDGFRKFLVGLQFFLSIAILICTLVIYRQVNFMLTSNTGVDRQNIIVIHTNLWYECEDFIKVIKQENPNIIDATIANAAPYNGSYGQSGFTWEGSSRSIKEYNILYSDTHYASVFGLKMIEGEYIRPNLPWWQFTKSESLDIVINETFEKQMGVDNPIGMTVGNGLGGMKGKIIGVVKDFNFKPLKEKIGPLVIGFNPEASVNLYIKTSGKKKQATLQYILNKYEEMKSKHKGPLVHYTTVQDDYALMYQSEIRTVKILAVFSLISLLISLMGILSMVSFMVEKRIKEIAIRRINGAALKDIVSLFLKDFALIALMSSLVAIPISFLLMHHWLQGYVYRIALSGWMFASIPLVIMAITALVITIQVFLTARRNPVELLRAE